MARRGCQRRVFGSRDFTGHLCLNAALAGSDFCRVHQPESEREDPRRDTDQSPDITSRQQTTYYARLEWLPGQGPVVKAPNRSGYGFITKVTAKATDDGPMSVAVYGVMRKKDGAPGAQAWDATWHGEELVPERWMAELKDRMDKERAR